MVQLHDKANVAFIALCFILVVLILIFGDYIIPNWEELLK